MPYGHHFYTSTIIASVKVKSTWPFLTVRKRLSKWSSSRKNTRGIFFVNCRNGVRQNWLTLPMRSSKTFQDTAQGLRATPRNGISWARASWTTIRENIAFLSNRFVFLVMSNFLATLIFKRLHAGNTFKNPDQRMSLFFSNSKKCRPISAVLNEWMMYQSF